MSVQIKYLNKKNGVPSSNIVLFVNEKFNLNPIKKYISSNEYSYISDLLKTPLTKKKIFLFLR